MTLSERVVELSSEIGDLRIRIADAEGSLSTLQESIRAKAELFKKMALVHHPAPTTLLWCADELRALLPTEDAGTMSVPGEAKEG